MDAGEPKLVKAESVGSQPQGQFGGGFGSTDTSMVSHQPQSQFGGAHMADGDDEQKKNLWRSLLQSVGQRTENRASHVLLLGDRNAGKRSLIKAMNKPFMKQLGLQLNVFDDIGSDYSLFESTFLYARDIMDIGEEAQQIGMEESLTRINVWVLSEEEMTNMLPKVLTPEDLEFTFAIIVPDLEQPWDLIVQCQRWMDALSKAIYQISPKLKLKTLEMLKERMEELYKTYKEPELDKDGKLINKRIRKIKKSVEPGSVDNSGLDLDPGINYDEQEMMDDLRKEIELPEGVLVTNIFIPSAIVCSKVDLIEHGEKEIKQTLEQNIDFIQYSLRKFCLHYGSSLIFASANSGSNIPVLYDYILSRLYDADFVHSSKIDDKEALFVPTGFDSPELIGQMDLKKVKQQRNAELDEIQYADVIKKPGQKSQFVEERKEVECPDWRKTLEAAHLDKIEKEQHRKQYKPGQRKPPVGLPTPPAQMRASAKPSESKAKGAAQAKADASGAKEEDGNQGDSNQDQKKKAKVKDFYSNLLNKKQKDKIGTPKGSATPTTQPAAPDQNGAGK